MQVRSTMRMGLVGRLAAVTGLAAALGGCLGYDGEVQRGYVVDTYELAQLKPGTPAQTVLTNLGTPSTTSTVGGDAWYYISQKVDRPLAFLAAAGHRPAHRRGLLRQQEERHARRQLRPRGRQGGRYRQPHHADRRRRAGLSQEPVPFAAALQLVTAKSLVQFIRHGRLVPAIHVSAPRCARLCRIPWPQNAWMAGTSPAMT